METQKGRGTILGLVPARGGSKGIARKNARLLAGKPLLAYTADAARGATGLSRILLSTDDPDIASIGKSAGLEVPFLRPAELAIDSTPMIDVVLHVIHWFRDQGLNYDAVCLLQPTSPLRTSATIDRCVSLLWDRDVDSVMSVRPVPTEHNPYWVYFADTDGLLRPSVGDKPEVPCRQQLPQAFHADGSIFLARTEKILAERSLKCKRMLGAVSPEEEAFDLDTEEQWRALERLLISR
ncbi:MAG TPA: acylneuraminate cytidylyltransferase family protein [Candidatus Sulfotelmatobacter sp.]|nr:acylneuraminate cytidylyltransferase family protein [Candidatus Sulfotelmatobacter sp.]